VLAVALATTAICLGLALVASGAQAAECKEALEGAGGGPCFAESHIEAINVEPCDASGTIAALAEDKLPADPTAVGPCPEADLERQAGEHPYALVGDAVIAPESCTGLCKFPYFTADLRTIAPPGLAILPASEPRCTAAEFYGKGAPVGPNQVEPGCPTDTMIGKVSVVIKIGQAAEPGELTAAVWNMVPEPGEPARFAFSFANKAEFAEPVSIADAGVRASGNHEGFIRLKNNPPLHQLVRSTLVLWGAPQEHNGCMPIPNPLTTAPDGTPNCGAPDRPFLTNSTSCETAQSTSATATGYADPREAELVGEAEQNALENTFEQEPLYERVSAAALDALGALRRAPSQSMVHVGPAMTGCDKLRYGSNSRESTGVDAPSLSVTPTDAHGEDAGSVQTDSPTGMDVTLRLPQDEDPALLATPQLRSDSLAFPPGFSINAGAAAPAGGLETCTDEEFQTEGSESEPERLAPITCPAGSRIGKVLFSSPALSVPLEGALYLGSQTNAEPFRLFLDGTGPGVDIRLKGSTFSNPTTGQLTSEFKDLPQEPVSEVKVELNNGVQAPIASPLDCGTFTSEAELQPWSGIDPAFPTASTSVDSNGNGGACPSPLPFRPSVRLSTGSPSGGAASSLTFSLTRTAGQPYLSHVSTAFPPGLIGSAASVTQCPEPGASRGECSSASEVGTAKVAVGAGSQANGSEPLVLTGRLYFTGPYDGDPFGLVVVTPAEAGPYKFGTSVVRVGIGIDPLDAHLTTTAEIPRMQDFKTKLGEQGLPSRVQSVTLTTDRPGFISNPTECSPPPGSATLEGEDPNYGSGRAPTTSTYTAPLPISLNGCSSLPFSPKFAASTDARTSKLRGASLTTTITTPGGMKANLRYVKVALPKQLPTRLTTLQKACIDRVFEANPAVCPSGSVLGTATALTPLLKAPLAGPVYFVSHGGAAFPDLEILLQGENGVKEVLDGQNFVSQQGITSTTFAHLPDVPFRSFTLNLPEGPNSALSAIGDLCSQRLLIPTTMIAQNGKQLIENTKISVIGCPPHVKLVGHSYKAGVLTLRLSSSAAGRLAVSAPGLRGKVFHTFAKAGSVTLHIRLSKASISKLRSRHHLALRIEIGLAPKERASRPLKFAANVVL
jgi:hypothetical protein